MAGPDHGPHRQRQRLPLLRGAESAARLQRPGQPGAGDRRPVAPGPQRRPDAGHGDGGEPQKGVVAVSQRPRLEGRGLFPGPGPQVRLPGVRGRGERQAAAPLSGRTGQSWKTCFKSGDNSRRLMKIDFPANPKKAGIPTESGKI